MPAICIVSHTPTVSCIKSHRMPEGPELHLASLFVNRVCEGVVFTGPVRKSEVSKSPDVPYNCKAYRITATSRGKEVKLTLTPVKSDETKSWAKGGQASQPMDIVFRFGMSGFFRFTPEDELPKHAHLRFHSNESPCRVLSFVDTRRFGSWQPNGTWQPDRGPCIMFEYKSFRENILSQLSDHAFERPICEVLLNQKYFNGIGNYLRAEILFRLNIQPFVQARSVLEGIELKDPFENDDEKPTKEEITHAKILDRDLKTDVRVGTPDLLRLCHTVPLEVIKQGGKGYDPQKVDYSEFKAWLQCYSVDGMNSLKDHNGRTMWFKGDAGPMVPKVLKSTKAKKRVKKEEDHDCTKVASKKTECISQAKRVKKESQVEKGKKYVTKKRSVSNSRRSTPNDFVSLDGNIQSPHRKNKVTVTAAVQQRQSSRVTRSSSK